MSLFQHDLDGHGQPTSTAPHYDAGKALLPVPVLAVWTLVSAAVVFLAERSRTAGYGMTAPTSTPSPAR